MKIGIDIDGVLTDIERFILDYGIKFCIENGIEYKIKEDEYFETDALGISEEQAEKFWNQYLEFYATKYPARDFAKEVIHKLRKDHEIYIVTARNEEGLPPETYGQMQNLVKQWLKDNEIEYDKLIFTPDSKLETCLKNNVDVMIEDWAKNIEEIASKIPVFCFDNLYNKQVEGTNITRVYSWYDVLTKITPSIYKISY